MLKNFENIPVELPMLSILKRMGYNRHLTGISPEHAKKINYYIEECYKICAPAGRYDRIGILSNDGVEVRLESGDCITSVSVAKLLERSSEVVILGARISSEVLKSIDEFVLEKNGVAALIYDAVASEVVDDCLGWMIKRLGTDLSRLGLRPTSRRFSAGYGDFPLENQAIFYRLLRLSELGVELTEKYIFVPEKTVTAICGLE